MELKILILERDQKSLELMRREIESMDAEVIEAVDGHEVVDLAKRVYPALIIMDIKQLSGSRNSMILEELQRSLVTREIPLVLTHSSPDIAWQEKYRVLGVRELVQKPFEGPEFYRCIRQLLDEGRGPMDYSERFARAFAAYSRTDTIAEQMIAKAAIAAKIHGLDTILLEQVTSALAILSVPIVHQNTQEVLGLCASAMLPHEIVQLVAESGNPSGVAGALVYSIVELTQKSLHNRPLYIAPLASEYDAVFTTVRALFESGLIRIRTEEDVQLAWKELSERILDAREYSLKEVSDFLERTLECIKKTLLSRYEVFMRLCGEGTVPRVELFFKAGAGDNPCGEIVPQTDAVAIAYESAEPNILEQTGTSYASAVITLSVENLVDKRVDAVDAGESEAGAPMDLFDQLAAMTAPAAPDARGTENTDTISAVEFLKATHVDSEDLETLEELEGEITREVERGEQEVAAFEKMQRIVEIFRRYSTTIMYISEFSQIVDALLDLSATLEGMDATALDERRLQLVLDLLEKLADDLYQWRKAVFIEQRAQNIHFMDDSIIASCKQVQSFLPKNVPDETAGAAAITLF